MLGSRYGNIGTVLFICAAFLCAGSPAAAQGEAVRIAFIKGGPKLMKADTDEWIGAKAGMDVGNGDRIKTGSGEFVEILFGADKSKVMRIEEFSDVIIKKGTPPDYSVELLSGKVKSLIKKLSDKSRFEIRTPVAVGGVRGTGWQSFTDGVKAAFDAFEKSIYVKGIDESGREIEGEVIVKSGFRSAVNKFERPGRPERIPRADIARWNSWRKEIAERLGVTEGAPQAEQDERLANTIENTAETVAERLSDKRDEDKVNKRLDDGENRSRTSSNDDGGGQRLQG